MTGYIMAQVFGGGTVPDEALLPLLHLPTPIQPTGDLEYRMAQMEQWMKIVLDETGIGKRRGGM